MQSVSEKNRIILPPEEALPADSSSFVAWILFFLRPYGRTLGGFFCLRVVRYTIIMLLPLAIGLTIKAFEDGWAYRDPGKLVVWAAVYMLLYGLCLLMVQLFFFESATQDRAVRGMTLFAVRHMNSLPLGWHEAEGSGGKLQRVMTARASMKQLFDMYKWDFVPFAGSVLAIGISVLTIDAPPFLLLYYLGFILSFCAAGWHYARPLPALHNRHNALLEKLVSGVYEFIGAVRTVKSFSMESYIERKANAHELEGHAAMRSVFYATFFKWTMLNAIGYFWTLAFFITCVAGVYSGWLGIGAFATIFFLAHDLWKTLENLVYVQDKYIEHRNGFMRLTDMLKEKPALLDKEPVAPLPGDWKTIRFENVSYRYRGAGKAALHDIALEIRRGEKIALVGASGAGKSTFVRLLMKQALPDSGTIEIDGTDLAHIEGAAWIGQCGFVPQDVELFNMSIRDNILLDRIGEIDETTYRHAIEQAAFKSFIDSLPEGDATVIGERGIKLSGGQRQRLGIARALVRQAELIVFDEATSALDSLSEQAIQEAIDDSFTGKTLVVIAHRLSTVRHVDRIFVLAHGQLAEEGSFEELVKAEGIFAKLWALQSGGFTPL